MAVISGSAGNDNLVGTASDDTMNGYGGNDTIDGGAGNDQITGGNGNDTIYGGAGADILVGDIVARDPNYTGINTMYGGDGNDQFWGGLAGDRMYGGANDDIFNVQGTDGGAYYDGGIGRDVIYISDYNGYNPAGNSYVVLQIAGITGVEAIANVSGKAAHIVSLTSNLDLSETDLIDITKIRGGTQDEVIKGHTVYNSGSQTYTGIIIEANAGNDNVTGSSLGDVLYGDAGNDTISGLDGDDFIYGGTGIDTLIGNNGVDRLYGDAGQDRLAGQGGNDLLTGGADADQFWFNLNGGQDTVADFQDGVDKFVLGTDIKNVNVFVGPNGYATLDLYNSAASIPHTYVLLQNVTTAQIDGSDFLWAA